MLQLEVLEAQREGELLGSLEINLGVKEIIPRAHERKVSHDDQRGAGQRQDDSDNDPHLRATINSRLTEHQGGKRVVGALVRAGRIEQWEEGKIITWRIPRSTGAAR